MERGVIGSICSLSFIIFLMCLIEVSSTPVHQQETSILDTMKQDKNLSCKIQSLISSDLLKSCNNVTYPVSDAITLSLSYKDIFLCLGVYDSFYKICNYAYHNATNLDIDIQKLTSTMQLPLSFQGDKNQTEIMFCESVKGLTPAYEKTKPLLSTYMSKFSNPDVCKPVCFDITHTFNPLCAILAWIKNIDQIVKENEKGSKSSETVLTKPNTTPATNYNTVNKSSQSEQPSHPNKPIPVEDKIHQQEDKQNSPQQSPVQDENDKLKTVPEEHTDAASPSTQKKADTANSVIAVDSQSKPNTVDTKPNTVDTKPAKTPGKDNIPPEVINEPGTSIDETVKPSPSKPEITNISENTQELDVGFNPDDRNNVEDTMGSDYVFERPAKVAVKNQNRLEPSEQRESTLHHFHSIRNEEDSHFFTYFIIISLVCIAGYVGYLNKQKVLAIVLEGRRSRSNRNRRRPSTASYRKLDCTLEEAVTSQCNANVTHVIY